MKLTLEEKLISEYLKEAGRLLPGKVIEIIFELF